MRRPKGMMRPKRKHPNKDDRLIEAAQRRLLRDCDFVEACDMLTLSRELTDGQREILRRMAG